MGFFLRMVMVTVLGCTVISSAGSLSRWKDSAVASASGESSPSAMGMVTSLAASSLSSSSSSPNSSRAGGGGGSCSKAAGGGSSWMSGCDTSCGGGTDGGLGGDVVLMAGGGARGRCGIGSVDAVDDADSDHFSFFFSRFMPMESDSVSMGNGNTMVELCSVEMALSVCR